METVLPTDMTIFEYKSDYDKISCYKYFICVSMHGKWNVKSRDCNNNNQYINHAEIRQSDDKPSKQKLLPLTYLKDQASITNNNCGISLEI